MSSHAEFLSTITGFSEIGIREIINISITHKKRYSTLIQNYRKALEIKKNVSARRKGIEKHLERDGMICFVSLRNKNSEFVGNVLNLNEDGLYNLRIIRYLLSQHNFLASGAFALVGGLLNSNSATSVISSKFRNKEEFLNSIPKHIAKIRLETFLKTELAKFKNHLKEIDSILDSMEGNFN